MNTRAAKRCAQVFLAAAGAIALSGAALVLASGHSHPVAASTRTVASANVVRLPTVVIPTAHSTTTAKSEPSPMLAPSSVPTPSPPVTSGATAPKTVRPVVASSAVPNTTTTMDPATPHPSEPAERMYRDVDGSRRYPERL